MRQDPNFHGIENMAGLPPWSTAAIARESVARGNEYRNQIPREADIRRLANTHHRVYVDSPQPGITAIVGPIFYEQFHWQLSVFEEATRSQLLFADPSFGPVFDWTPELGADLTAALRALFVIDGSVRTHRGTWSPTFLEDFSDTDWDVLATDPNTVLEVARRLTATPEEIRDAILHGPAMPSDMARYPYNPLETRPMIDLGSQGVVAPVGSMLTRALLPRILYYRGADRWGRDFTRVLGERHETYVGGLFRNVAPNLLGEVTFGHGGGSKSVDWIWVTDRAVVLIECKSARMAIDAQAGGGRFDEIVDRYLRKARQQIDRSADEIRAHNPQFAGVPSDRPLVGLTVTAEPIYLANTDLPEWSTHGAVPAVVASLRDIEHLTSLSSVDALDAVLRVVEDRRLSTWDFGTALRGSGTGNETHPLADAAWKQIDPFASSSELTQT